MADTGFTGVAALNYLKRLLAMENISQDKWKNPAFYDFLSEGRDMVQVGLAMSAPITVREFVDLSDDGSGVFTFTSDPLRVLVMRHKTTLMELIPSSALDRDTGDYEWTDIRTIQLASGLTPSGGVEAVCILHQAALTKSTTPSAWGIPQPAHRLACKGAALIMLGTDEELSPTNMTGLFQREMNLLETLYSEFDGQGGLIMREAFMSMYGEWMSDSIY